MAARKIEPMITWVPWKPVPIKKMEPNILSEIEKRVSLYSEYWRKVKYRPSMIVIRRR
jgi:hypothetical protein